ncbi:MAG: DHH family phosphoesterase [Clostridia bacterium]|nr:DHH family phosphoesterase [Clostridia bacterium]
MRKIKGEMTTVSSFREITLGECADRLLEIKRPLVLMHVRPDGDTVGCCAALIEVYRQLGVAAKYACSDKIPDRLAFLLEGCEMADESEYGLLTPVSVDVPSPMQLGRIKDKLPKIELMIDHHEVSVPFADIYTVRGMSSGGEVMLGAVRELCERGLISLTPRLASSLYAAICSDTGQFAYSCATSTTYRAAAELIDAGADFVSINHRLFMQKSEKLLRAEGVILGRLLTSADGRLSYSYISKRERDSLGLMMEHFETSIDLVRAVKGAEISFIVKETDEGEFKGSLRSVEADVTPLALEFSGGGHTHAAGCTVVADSCEQAAEILRLAIEKRYFGS